MKAEGELETNLTPTPPQELDAEFWEKARLVEPEGPRSVHLKLDPEVFAFFKGLGKGHITRMQDVLRAYAEAHRRR